MTNGTCSLPDCAKPLKRGGYCYSHYMKNWRYGTPTPDHAPKWEDLTGRRFGALVVIVRQDGRWLCACDCGATTRIRSGDLNRGTVASCGDRAIHIRRDDVGYSAAHERVRSDRGLVQQLTCIDCSRPAQHWSYNHTDPSEQLAHGLSAKPVAYSTKPSHYSPRCVPCHKQFDLGRTDAQRIA